MLRGMRHLALAMLVIAAAPTIAGAQQTMREQVLTMGVSEELVITEYPSMPLSVLTGTAGAVVHVALRSHDTFLSSDGTDILTDYRATVVDVLKESTGQGIGAGDIITIRRAGGSMNIAGRQVLSHESGFPSFESGREYVLFLKTDAGQPFAMLAGPQSAYRIHDGGIAPMIEAEKGSAVVRTPTFIHLVRALLGQETHITSQR
jgi:hypothetical protein